MIIFKLLRAKLLVHSPQAKAAAIIAGCDAQQAEKMYDFGLQLGIAFQLVDDLLDLYGDDRLGKPWGVDVQKER